MITTITRKMDWGPTQHGHGAFWIMCTVWPLLGGHPFCKRNLTAGGSWPFKRVTDIKINNGTKPQNFLPPEFQRMREGYVFTGVCLPTGGVPQVFGPWSFLGVPHGLWSLVLSGGGGYPRQGRGYFPSRHTEWGRMCGAGGMPLAFTREDFLVVVFKSVDKAQKNWLCIGSNHPMQ